MIKTEDLAADLSHIEKSIKKRTKWVQIVKSLEHNEEIYDDKREMTYIAINNSTDPKIKKLMIELTAITKAIEEDSIIQPLHGLHSKPKGSKQLFHGDYDLESISKLKKGKKIYSCVFSFSNETHVYFEGCKAIFFIPKGHLLIFDHIVLHAGGCYQKNNYRLFFKLACENNQFPFDAGEDIVLSRHCRYCGASLIRKSKMSDHSWVCSKNPKGEENRERKNAKRRKGNLKSKDEPKIDDEAKQLGCKKRSKRPKGSIKKEDEAMICALEKRRTLAAK